MLAELRRSLKEVPPKGELGDWDALAKQFHSSFSF